MDFCFCVHLDCVYFSSLSLLDREIKVESRLQLRYKISLDGLLDLRNRYRSRLNGTDKTYSLLNARNEFFPEGKSYLKIKNSREKYIQLMH